MVGYTVALVVADAGAAPGRRPRVDLHRRRRGARRRASSPAPIALVRRPTPAASMRVFTFSITYVTLLFGALTVDVLVAGVTASLGLPSVAISAVAGRDQ